MNHISRLIVLCSFLFSPLMALAESEYAPIRVIPIYFEPTVGPFLDFETEIQPDWVRASIIQTGVTTIEKGAHRSGVIVLFHNPHPQGTLDTQAIEGRGTLWTYPENGHSVLKFEVEMGIGRRTTLNKYTVQFHEPISLTNPREGLRADVYLSVHDGKKRRFSKFDVQGELEIPAEGRVEIPNYYRLRGCAGGF